MLSQRVSVSTEEVSDSIKKTFVILHKRKIISCGMFDKLLRQKVQRAEVAKEKFNSTSIAFVDVC